jgi:signal transduction histidine kinase
MKKRYFLFGTNVCRAYDDDGIDAAIETANDDGGYGLFEWDENSDPAQLLSEAEGWDAWAEITEEEAEKFSKETTPQS